MSWRKLLIPGSVVGVAAAVAVGAFCWGRQPEISAKIFRMESSTDDLNVVRVTVRLTNPGPGLVWFGPHQRQQVKAGVEWSAPERLDALSYVVMQPRTNLDVVIAVPKAVRACRLLLSYGENPNRTKWAWFCNRHDKICSKVPTLCFWVGQRLREEPEWRSREIELLLPDRVERARSVVRPAHNRARAVDAPITCLFAFDERTPGSASLGLTR